MNSPQPPKRKRTQSPSRLSPRRRLIEDEEEAEEIVSSDDDLEDDHADAGLVGRRTVLISGLKPEEYALALTKLQGLGLPIVSDEAPFCSVTGVMGLDIPADEVERTAEVLEGAWQGPGRISIEVFRPARERIKVAIRVANKGDFAVVMLDALTTYLDRKGVVLNPAHASLSMVVPGTWLLLLDDATTAEGICALCRIVLLGKELDVGPWKEGYAQGGNRVYIQGLAEITSRRAVVEFLRRKCGDVTDHFFGRLSDSRMAPWMTIQFRTAAGMNKALALNGRKSFNGKAITIVRSKTAEEREADLRNQASQERRREDRIAASQARQQRQADRRADNAVALAAYTQQAAQATASFAGLL